MKFKILFLTTIAGIIYAELANAFCPVCVVAASAGLGLSKYFGIDDTISSLWIGALLISLVAWTNNWLKSKNWDFKFYKVATFLTYYLLTLGPLYYSDLIGHPYNKFFGIDKILFGTILGTLVFVLAHYLHLYLKKKNQGKSYFNYQKVVIPISLIILTNIIIYFIIKK